jgi:hypothetical protein
MARATSTSRCCSFCWRMTRVSTLHSASPRPRPPVATAKQSKVLLYVCRQGQGCPHFIFTFELTIAQCHDRRWLAAIGLYFQENGSLLPPPPCPRYGSVRKKCVPNGGGCALDKGVLCTREGGGKLCFVVQGDKTRLQKNGIPEGHDRESFWHWAALPAIRGHGKGRGLASTRSFSSCAACPAKGCWFSVSINRSSVFSPMFCRRQDYCPFHSK